MVVLHLVSAGKIRRNFEGIGGSFGVGGHLLVLSYQVVVVIYFLRIDGTGVNSAVATVPGTRRLLYSSQE